MMGEEDEAAFSSSEAQNFGPTREPTRPGNSPRKEERLVINEDSTRFPQSVPPWRYRSWFENPLPGTKSFDGAGYPCDTLMIEKIPYSLSLDDLEISLQRDTALVGCPTWHVDSIPYSPKGYRRAFMQFRRISEAERFIREHYPILRLQLTKHNEDIPEGYVDVPVYYADPRDGFGDVRSRDDWRCADCHYVNYAWREDCKQCFRDQPASYWGRQLAGKYDIGQEPSQILVIYPLPDFINEDVLANASKTLEAAAVPTAGSETAAALTTEAAEGARKDSISRVFLMKDAKTHRSFNYGFIEFWTLEDAEAAFNKSKQPPGFTMAGCKVTVDYIGPDVFVPTWRAPTLGDEHLSFWCLGDRSEQGAPVPYLVQYRDHHVYPSPKVVNSLPPAPISVAPDAKDQKAKKSKKRKMDGKEDSSSKKRLPHMPQLDRWQKTRKEIHHDGDSAKGLEGGRGKINFSFNSKAAQSHDADTALSATTAPTTAVAASSTECKPHPNPEVQTAELPQNAVLDREKLICYLCKRSVKEPHLLDQHLKTQVHLNNMKDEKQWQAAVEKVRRSAAAHAQETSQYRDRAKERRAALGQPSKPKPPNPQRKDTQAAEAPAEKNESKPVVSKGATMLEKFGYQAGAGLGAKGEGRTDIISANVYQAGVGLGAEGGNLGDATKEAERKTKGTYKDYLDSVNDKARERFQKL